MCVVFNSTRCSHQFDDRTKADYYGIESFRPHKTMS